MTGLTHGPHPPGPRRRSAWLGALVCLAGPLIVITTPARALDASGNPTQTVELGCPATGEPTGDTRCLQSVIDRLCAAGTGGEVALARGRYAVSGLTIGCSGVTLAGIGPGSGKADGTTILLTGGDGPGIAFHGSGANRLRGARVSGLRIDGEKRTGGAAVLFDAVEHGSVDNLVLRNVPDGIDLGSGIHYAVTNVYMDQVRGTGISVHGSFPKTCPGIADCPERQDVVALQDIFMGSALGHERDMTGIHWQDFSATLNIRNVQIVNPNYGVLVECRTGLMDACPHFLNGWNLEVDFAGSQAVRASDFQEIRCFGCYFNGKDDKTGNLLSFFNERLDSSAGVQLIGGKALGSGQNIIDLAVGNAHIRGMDIYLGSRTTPGAFSGILVRGSEGRGAANVVIDGNVFCTFGNETPSSMRGVTAADGTVSVIVAQNFFSGCAEGWTDRTGGAETLSINNIGP